eukprot:sb/3461410/
MCLGCQPPLPKFHSKNSDVPLMTCFFFQRRPKENDPRTLNVEQSRSSKRCRDSNQKHLKDTDLDNPNPRSQNIKRRSTSPVISQDILSVKHTRRSGRLIEGTPTHFPEEDYSVVKDTPSSYDRLINGTPAKDKSHLTKDKNVSQSVKDKILSQDKVSSKDKPSSQDRPHKASHRTGKDKKKKQDVHHRRDKENGVLPSRPTRENGVPPSRPARENGHSNGKENGISISRETRPLPPPPLPSRSKPPSKQHRSKRESDNSKQGSDLVAIHKDYSLLKFDNNKNEGRKRGKRRHKPPSSEFDPCIMAGISSEEEGSSSGSSDSTVTTEMHVDTISYDSHANYHGNHGNHSTHMKLVEESHKRLRRRKKKKKKEEDESDEKEIRTSYHRYSVQSINSSVINNMIDNAEPYTALHRNKKSIAEVVRTEIRVASLDDRVVKTTLIHPDTSSSSSSSSAKASSASSDSDPSPPPPPSSRKRPPPVPPREPHDGIDTQLASFKSRLNAISARVQQESPQPTRSLATLSEQDFTSGLNGFLYEFCKRIQARQLRFSEAEETEDEIDRMDEEAIANSDLLRTFQRNRDYNKNMELSKSIRLDGSGVPHLTLAMPHPSSSGIASSVNTSSCTTTQDSFHSLEMSRDTVAVQTDGGVVIQGTGDQELEGLTQTKSDVSVGCTSSDDNNRIHTQDKGTGTEDLNGGGGGSLYQSVLNSSSENKSTSSNNPPDTSNSPGSSGGGGGGLAVSVFPPSDLSTPISTLERGIPPPISTSPESPERRVTWSERVEEHSDGGDLQHHHQDDDMTSPVVVMTSSPGLVTSSPSRLSQEGGDDGDVEMTEQDFQESPKPPDTGQLSVESREMDQVAAAAAAAVNTTVGHVSVDINPFPFMQVRQVHSNKGPPPPRRRTYSDLDRPPGSASFEKILNNSVDLTLAPNIPPNFAAAGSGSLRSRKESASSNGSSHLNNLGDGGGSKGSRESLNSASNSCNIDTGALPHISEGLPSPVSNVPNDPLGGSSSSSSMNMDVFPTHTLRKPFNICLKSSLPPPPPSSPLHFQFNLFDSSMVDKEGESKDLPISLGGGSVEFDGAAAVPHIPSSSP